MLLSVWKELPLLHRIAAHKKPASGAGTKRPAKTASGDAKRAKNTGMERTACQPAPGGAGLHQLPCA